MAKLKRKRTAAERRAKRERDRNFKFVFVNGKRKRVRRPPMIEGMTVDEFIAQNADPIFLQQNELWELMTPYGDTMSVTDEHNFNNDDQYDDDDETMPF